MAMLTAKRVKDYCRVLGADLVGIASINRFVDLPQMSNPASILPGAKSVIVVAKKFLFSASQTASTIPYTIIRNRLSWQLDELSCDLARYLKDRGFAALPTGAIEPCNYNAELQKTVGLISLKNAARQAGLGVIGKNTLLLTPEFGNMVWLGAVITAAALAADTPQQDSPCAAGCRICLDACPVLALSGSPFIDQQKCWDYAFGCEDGGEWRIKCFECRRRCPHAYGYARKKG
jgi:epoxyqueuosine reductase